MNELSPVNPESGEPYFIAKGEWGSGWSSGALTFFPPPWEFRESIKPGTFVIDYRGREIYDDGNGNLICAALVVGTINYITNVYTFDPNRI